MRYSKFVVTLIILLNVLFVVASFYVFLQVGHEMQFLTTAWFAFTTGELWLLAGIKKKECVKDDENKLETENVLTQVLGHGDNASHNNSNSP